MEKTRFVAKILLVILVVAMLGALGYILAAPKISESFTEFYILGPEGPAAGYPKELVVGQETKVIVGIANREHKTVAYRVEVSIDGARHLLILPYYYYTVNPPSKKTSLVTV